MARRTSALRIALAILAACLFAPFAYSALSLAVALVEGLGRPGDLGLGDILSAILFVWLASVLIVTPVTLGLIAFPLSVFWLLHHRAGGGPLSFLAGGATAGFILGLALIGASAEAGSADAVLTVLIFVLTAALTTGVLWLVAYGRRPDPAAQPARPGSTAFEASE